MIVGEDIARVMRPKEAPKEAARQENVPSLAKIAFAPLKAFLDAGRA